MENILAGQTLTAATLNNWTPEPLSDSVTPATGFTVGSFTVSWIAGITFFSVNLTYTGSTLTGSSTGVLTPAPTNCCTLPFAPQDTMTLEYKVGGSGSGCVLIATNGVCTLTTLMPTATIATGNAVLFSGIILTG